MKTPFFLFDLYLATTADVGSDAKIRTWKILFLKKKMEYQLLDIQAVIGLKNGVLCKLI